MRVGYPPDVTASRPFVAARTLALPLVSVGLLLIVLLLPDLGPTPTGPEPVTAFHARIVALLEPQRTNPAAPGAGFLPDARVLVLEGPQAGTEVEAYLEGPGGQQSSTAYKVGDEVVMTSTAAPNGPPFVAVSDRWRLPQLAILAAVFGLAVVVVGGWRGVRALLALALTIAVVIRILVPLLLRGVPPIPLAIAIATLIAILTIALTEGFSRASVAAILGTAGALALTAVLAAVATVAAGFTNAAGTDLAFLQTAGGSGLDLRGLLLAAFMLGAIGVLDDVTVTQAAAVEELTTHGGLRGRALYASAFNLGRSHIAATVNTLFLAYAGASLPLLVLFAVSRQPTLLIVNGEAVSVEIVRTLVGSLGIVAAVPFTTAIAAWLATPGASADGAHGTIAGREPARRGILRRPAVALVLGLATIGLVVAVASAVMAPLIASGPGVPLTPDRFEPSPSVIAGSFDPNASDSAPVEPSTVPVIQVGGVETAFEGQGDFATVAVLERRLPAPVSSSAPQLVDVRIRYEATTPFTVRTAAWVAVGTDLDNITARPRSGPEPWLAEGPLAIGEVREGWLEFELPARGEDLFLDYRDVDGTPLFSVQLY